VAVARIVVVAVEAADIMVAAAEVVALRMVVAAVAITNSHHL
jgi:hypothetical protein